MFFKPLTFLLLLAGEGEHRHDGAVATALVRGRPGCQGSRGAQHRHGHMLGLLSELLYPLTCGAWDMSQKHR